MYNNINIWSIVYKDIRIYLLKRYKYKSVLVILIKRNLRMTRFKESHTVWIECHEQRWMVYFTTRIFARLPLQITTHVKFYNILFFWYCGFWHTFISGNIITDSANYETQNKIIKYNILMSRLFRIVYRFER